MRVVEGVADADDLDAFLADLDGVGEATGTAVQAFDARYVVGREHLRRAVELADRAFDRGENVARDRGVEILLYAAGRRQINRALEMGVDGGETPVVVVVDSPENDGTAEAAAAERIRALLDPAETLDDYDEALIREFFDVGDAELEAVDGGLADLVAERVALLVVEK